MVLTSFLDLFLASSCLLCDRPETSQGLCRDCQCQLQDCRWKGVGLSISRHRPGVPQPRHVSSVARHAQRFPPTPKRRDGLALVTWGQYGGVLKRAIANLKYQGKTQLAETLGLGLAEAWLATQPGLRPQVIPIPLHAEKQQQRGFNQADLIARAFCRRTGLTLNTKGLKRLRSTTPQFSLSKTERQENLTDAFVYEAPRGLTPWHSLAPDRPVLLLDDIYTTGSTMESARLVLESAGMSVCGMVAVAQAGSSPAAECQSC